MALLDGLFAIIAPYDCLSCGQEGSLLCAWCRPDACPPLPPQCYRCHRLSSNSRVCAGCRSRTRLSYVWLRSEYDDLAKKLVHELKFSNNQAAAAVIAELMVDAMPFLPPEIVIVHIPTSTSHVRQRGYDQAKLIAKQLARRTGRQQAVLLGRTGQVQQVGSKRRERLTQLKDTFRTTHPGLIKGAHVLLVDDVVTTGATLEEAARTLKQAGAKQVDAVAFARTQ